jgi:hypothetical protein
MTELVAVKPVVAAITVVAGWFAIWKYVVVQIAKFIKAGCIPRYQILWLVTDYTQVVDHKIAKTMAEDSLLNLAHKQGHQE